MIIGPQSEGIFLSDSGIHCTIQSLQIIKEVTKIIPKFTRSLRITVEWRMEERGRRRTLQQERGEEKVTSNLYRGRGIRRCIMVVFQKDYQTTITFVNVFSFVRPQIIVSEWLGGRRSRIRIPTVHGP